MSLTTSQFADAFFEMLVAQGVVLDDEAAAKAAFTLQLTGWLGGEDALTADTAYRLMQTLGAWNQDVMQRLDWWTGSAVGGPNGDGTYPMTNAAGVTTFFPSLAKMLQVTAKGDPGGVSYTFDTATANADPGAGKLRFNDDELATVTRLYVDHASAAGGNLAPWLVAFGASSSAVKGQVSLQAGSTGEPIIFQIVGATAPHAGYSEIPVQHLAGATLPANGASLTVIFTAGGDHGDSLRYGVGAPGAGLGANGDVYLRLDTGLFYGPKAAGAWGAPIPQPEMASLLAQGVAARDVATGARDTAVTAAEVASDASEVALGAADDASDDAEATGTDRAAVADDKADIDGWLATFASDKDTVQAWLDQFGIDRPALEAFMTAKAEAAANSAADALAQADRAETIADSVDAPLIAAAIERVRRAAFHNLQV